MLIVDDSGLNRKMQVSGWCVGWLAGCTSTQPSRCGRRRGVSPSLMALYRAVSSVFLRQVRVFKGLGHACEEAEDGQQAVDMVRASLAAGGEPYDTVLTDYMMPVLDGPGAARGIRALGYKGKIFGWCVFPFFAPLPAVALVDD